MKILLVEDYSGVHANLKKALQKLGFEVNILGSGDSFKKLEYDFPLLKPKDNLYTDKYVIVRYIYRILQRVYSFFWLRTQYKRIMDYDIIQFINYRIGPFLFEYRLIDKILSNHKKTILIAAGCDFYYKKEIKQLKYSPCESCMQFDSNWHHKCNHGNIESKEFQILFDKKVSTVIPMAYDYYFTINQGSINKNKISQVIPFPIDLDAIRFNEIGSNKKLLIYHPLNRVGFKGTPIIQNVFKRLKEKYNSVAEFIVKGKMPLAEYLLFTQSVDIFVDQIYSQSYGMAAVIAMAQGKVVLSGLEDGIRSMDEKLYKECPIINIQPSEDSIYNKLEELILLSRDNLKDLGQASRTFVEHYHDSNSIAKKFIEVYDDLAKIDNKSSE